MRKPINKQTYHLLTLLIINILILLVLIIIAPEFRKFFTYSLLMQRMAEFAVLSTGVTVVILSGGLDLSFGSTLALSGALCGIFYNLGIPFTFSVVISLLICTLMGLFNALFIVRLGIHPIVITLAMMIIIRSLVYGITGGETVTGYSEAFIDFSNKFFFKIPVQFYVFIIIFAFMSVLINKTIMGMHIIAIGQNEKAAIISGILVNKIKYIVYSINGFLAGVSGILIVSRTNSLPPRTGDFALIEVVTAIVVGGVLMTGGEGTLIGPFLGVLIIYLLRTGFSILGIDVSYNLILLSLTLIIVLGRQQIASIFSKIYVRKK